jgi:rSAM/selenodomain-associated transferase 1
MPPLVIVFAKAPVPGRVKTRLTPPLRPEEAAALHERFVRETVARLAALPGVAFELHTDEPTTAWSDLPVRRRLQAPGGLGARMLAAIEAALAAGHPRAMIVGGDSPDLPAAHLQALVDGQSDVALGPARDGGYYAIACRRTHPQMFSDVRWSSPHALTDTIRAAAACGLSVEVGAPWRDIDTPEDLERYLREASCAG